MPEMSTKFTPEHMGEANPSKKLLKLAQKITDRIGHKVTADDPEYWGLACMVTEEMADIALTMKVRVKYTYEQLRKMNKVKPENEEKFRKLVDEMSYIGLLQYDYGDHYDKNGPIKDAPHIRYYWLPPFVPGSAEYMNMREENIEKHPELPIFFDRMAFLPLEKVTHMVPPGGAGIGMHVIPVEKAISMQNETMDIEHISYWLKKYEGHIGVSMCSCRYGMKTLDEGAADDYRDWCMGVGDMADYCRETGKGRDITYEEAMQILKNAEDNGYVHQVTNIDGEGKIFAICNCNVNVCHALRTSQLFNTPNMSRSAYVARVDSKNCVACGRCVEYCPAGAVKLGQKLCTKQGEVEYPLHELPDNNKWGKDKWDEDYRDNNRVNCYDTGTSPCKTACPAHIAVQGYLKKAAEGKYREALQLIKRENPFPAVCGRICNRRCEDACTRGTIDRAVSIDAVKKFIAEQDLKAEHRFVPDIVIGSNLQKSWDQKIAIIGGGPAGLSCAYYLAEKGYLPTVFEKQQKPGGMLTYGIPSYKLEKDVIEAEIDIMREMGVEIKCGVEVGKDVTIDELRKQGYKAFYIAIGCQGGRLPGVDGKDAKGVTTAVDFLRVANTGNVKVSGRTVVVGGGNVAIDAARVSSRSGADSVKMFCLEPKDGMPASAEEVKEAIEDGVDILNGYGPKQVLVKDGKAYAIVFKKCLSVTDENGKFAPKYDENDTLTVECENIIFAIGQRIEWGKLLESSKIELGRGNAPQADKLTYQTAESDVFVGGDVFTGPKFAIDAIAQGHEAAESLHRYVQNAHMTIGRNRRQFIELDKDNIVVESYDNSSRQEAKTDKSDKSFKDVHGTLTEEQVKIETSRCLGCGASVVDPNKCIGCGVCTTKCAFDAIHLFRERPECSNMVPTEDKFKVILPYAAKRAVKILFKGGKDKKTHTAEEKAD